MGCLGDVDAGGCLVCLVAGLGYWVCFGGVVGFCLGWQFTLVCMQDEGGFTYT